MSNRMAAAILGGIVLIVGIVLGSSSLSISQNYRSADGDQTVSCGSAFAGLSSEPDIAEFGGAIRDIYAGGSGSDNGSYVQRCEDKLSSQRTMAFVVIGVGALALVWSLLTWRPRVISQPFHEEEESEHQEPRDESEPTVT